MASLDPPKQRRKKKGVRKKGWIMRVSSALQRAMSMALAAGPATAPNAALLASRDAPLRRVLLCANSTVHGGCAKIVAGFI